MGVIATIPEKCKRCYSCVRECPVKAIKVLAGQATVVETLCIACGHCVRICTQGAKRIEDAAMFVKHLLDTGERVFACLAPSFPVAFYPVNPWKIVAAVRRLGFTEVWETAFGAELISREYSRLFKESRGKARAFISTPCPAVVAYVLKYLPALQGALAPIVSPMVAVARAIRKLHGAGVRIVFIGPCIAKKKEIKDPFIQGTVDAVLTFEELQGMIRDEGINPMELEPSGLGGPPANMGRAIPISGGLMRAAEINPDIMENDVLVTEGKDRVMAVLRELSEGRSRAVLFDLLLCEGCINGPRMPSELSVFTRKEILTDFIRAQNRQTPSNLLPKALKELRGLDLSREFTREPVSLPQPTEEEIVATLHRMRKFTPEDQLNCGSCGYPTCREKAVAVCQGLAEVEMCLPYMVDELDGTLKQLKQSTRDLQSTQSRLLHIEGLASMGQISAGVAHEINNPLNTILLYSHMLLKAHREGDPEMEDIQMIVREATRCRNIMRGLLDFARQSRVVKTSTDLGVLIREAVEATAPKRENGKVKLEYAVEENLPEVMLDAEQVRQMLQNLIQNGVDAIEETGEVMVKAGRAEGGDRVEIRVTDTGCGMTPEVRSEIFTPFFTTKQLGKGTGMGLSIVYGVVKMHSGDITVDSEAGRGTTVLISFPIREPERSAGSGMLIGGAGGEGWIGGVNPSDWTYSWLGAKPEGPPDAVSPALPEEAADPERGESP